MKKISFFLIGLAVSAIFNPITARADVAPPSKYVTLFFEQAGQPINDPVNFTIRCYGQTYDYQFNLNEEVIEVSDYSDTCQSYGCSFGLANTLDVYRTEERYCNISGSVNNQNFSVDNFLGDDLVNLKCDRADFTIYDGEYWKEAPGFDQCQQENNYDLDACREFLINMTDQLALNEEGYAYEELCDITVSLQDTVKPDKTDKINPEPGAKNIDKDQPPFQPNNSEIQPRPWYTRLYNVVRCFFLNIFGQKC